jgi:two-component system chemotaxis response regulator CheY
MRKMIDCMQLSILVVDDDSIARGYLKSALHALNCQKVHEASKADKVITACERHRPHIVFLDIDLGGSNGLDLIREVSQVLDGNYIVMVSAHSTLNNVKRALGEGARGFIVKPFTMAKIQEAINNACMYLNSEQHAEMENIEPKSTTSKKETDHSESEISEGITETQAENVDLDIDRGVESSS